MGLELSSHKGQYTRVTGRERSWPRRILQQLFERKMLPKPTERRIILCYHSVRPKDFLAYSISPALFEAHLAWLKQHCEIVDFAQIAKGQPQKRPQVALTFDDGYLDNLEYALPLLQKYQMRATFFVTAGLIEQDPATLEYFQKSLGASLRQIGPLDLPGLRSLQQCQMPIGSHSFSHRVMKSLSMPEQRAELTRSKRTLEDALGAPITALSYPYGVPGRAFDLRTLSIAEELGYQQAGAVQFRALKEGDNPLRMPRFVMTDETIDELEAMVYGALDALGWAHELRFALGSRA